jgi:hypothetical protein
MSKNLAHNALSNNLRPIMAQNHRFQSVAVQQQQHPATKQQPDATPSQPIDNPDRWHNLKLIMGTSLGLIGLVLVLIIGKNKR